MIQITAYLRDEADQVKWKALKNKTEWLHNALNPYENLTRTTVVSPSMFEGLKRVNDPGIKSRMPIPKSFSARRKK